MPRFIRCDQYLLSHDQQPDRGSIVDQMKYVTTVVLILKFEKILTFFH